jgi:sRNA-binding carbon storage regulator CsrA
MKKTVTRKYLHPGRTIISGEVSVVIESIIGQTVSVVVSSPFHVRVVRSDLDTHDKKDHDSQKTTR